MFERLIEIIIQSLQRLAKELERAYYDTFGDRASRSGEYLSWEFSDEVNKRRFINKDIYVKNAAIFIGKKTLQEEGYIMPPMQALAIAEAMFIDAEKNGRVDFLNNIISEE